jgi:tetratricopeptide (TPR) repeat protein
VVQRSGTLSNALAARGRAIQIIEQGLQWLPTDAVLWNLKGSLLTATNQIDEATQAFTKAIDFASADTNAFGKVLTEARLGRSAVLKRLNRLDEAAADNLGAYRIPPRDPRTKPELLDLSLVFTRELTAWLSLALDREAAKTFGDDVRKITGLDFDLRGVVRLAGRNWVESGHEPAPQTATDIPVARQFARMHVVHGASPSETDGVEIGAYVLHYVDGQTQALPIIFGEHLRDRDPSPQSEARVPTSAVVAWSSRNLDANLRRFYRTTYENPRPTLQVKSIDFISTMTKSGPFLIAITVEP